MAVIGRHTVSPALPLEVETSPGGMTKVQSDHAQFCTTLYQLVDLHTVMQLLHSSGQVILVNTLERGEEQI